MAATQTMTMTPMETMAPMSTMEASHPRGDVHDAHGPDGELLRVQAPVTELDPASMTNREKNFQDHVYEQQAAEMLEDEESGWFRSEDNRSEQERLAQIHLQTICRRVDERWQQGLCADRRWTNDPEAFPDVGLRGTATCNGVIPFPPCDQQYFASGIYDPATSKLLPSAIPDLMQDEHGNSTWVRLVDLAASSEACHVFDDTLVIQSASFGRIVQGELDNSYFIEALQALSLRPRLVQQLFYCWDVRRSIYILRIHKHGHWVRCEIDDLVPVGPPTLDIDRTSAAPICCRSESFPYVLWPSLVEKAYAKVHTARGDTSEATEQDSGGWEALGGGGRCEEALADLTGGVAGRFNTADVSAERLFIYIYELQRDTLFVCRVNEANCAMHGVGLNPYHPNIVNRAAIFDGGLYIQMYSGAPGLFDGGLSEEVPWELKNHPDYPDKSKDGFYWIKAVDFREYFGTVIECRLINSGDVSIPGMPPPRHSAVLTDIMAGQTPGSFPFAQTGIAGAIATAAPWREQCWANAGRISALNEPEIIITVPGNSCPCEVVCSVEQMDHRMFQKTGEREPQAPLLVKVYEQVDGHYYSRDMVCRSNWFPCRDTMVAFCARKGGEYRVVVEFPHEHIHINRMIVRVASQKPGMMCAVSAATIPHELVIPIAQPKAVRWTFCGFVRQERYDRGELPVDEPDPLPVEFDCMRKPEFDVQPGVEVFSKEMNKLTEDCVLM